MVILVYDRNKDSAAQASGILEKLYRKEDIHCFSQQEELLQYGQSHIFHVVFLSISRSPDQELAAAGKLVHLIPGVNLILAARDESYMAQALTLHASGYICLPFTEAKICSQLENLLYPVYDVLPEVEIRTDGDTCVYIDDVPVRFGYEKSAELFKLLVDMKGGMVNTGEMIDALFDEQKNLDRSRSYLQNIRSDLMHSLSKYGLEGAVRHRRGRMWIDLSRFRVKNR